MILRNTITGPLSNVVTKNGDSDYESTKINKK